MIRAAADLMYVKGVNGTTLDDVRAASGTSKSQLYRYFADKDDLVNEVVQLRSTTILRREEQRLRRLKSFNGLVRWRTALVQQNALQDGAYGCVLGSLANELADQTEQARSMMAETFTTWETLIAAGLKRMQDNGTLQADADPATLATGLLAALQGGYLLAQTAKDVAPMEVALDMALDHIKSLVVADKPANPDS
jgi:AcrR family transcriptional regulator